MQYLSRRKSYFRKEPDRSAKKIYIFCEGTVRETSYFSFFKYLSTNIDIIPIAPDNNQSDPLKLMDKADGYFSTNTGISLSEEYEDEVWFVIDTDNWNIGDKISTLREFTLKRNSASNPWTVAQSNPSFEIWLYYHLFADKPNNEEVITSGGLKAYVGKKINGGFDSTRHPVLISDAINNSKSVFYAIGGQPDLFSTELHFLGERILEFVRQGLEYLRSEMIKSENSN